MTGVERNLNDEMNVGTAAEIVGVRETTTGIADVTEATIGGTAGEIGIMTGETVIGRRIVKSLWSCIVKELYIIAASWESSRI